VVSRTIFIKTNNFRRIRHALLAYVGCGGLALKGLIGSKKLPFYAVKAAQDLSLHTNKETSYSYITQKVTKFYVTHTMNILIFIIITNKCP